MIGMCKGRKAKVGLQRQGGRWYVARYYRRRRRKKRMNIMYEEGEGKGRKGVL